MPGGFGTRRKNIDFDGPPERGDCEVEPDVSSADRQTVLSNEPRDASADQRVTHQYLSVGLRRSTSDP